MFEEVISHISMHRSLLNGWWLVFILQLTWPFEVDQCAVSSESDFDGKERLVEVLNSKILKACNIKLTHFLATLVALVFTLHCSVKLVSWSVVGWFQTSVTLRLATLFQAFDIGYCGCSSSTMPHCHWCGHCFRWSETIPADWRRGDFIIFTTVSATLIIMTVIIMVGR